MPGKRTVPCSARRIELAAPCAAFSHSSRTALLGRRRPLRDQVLGELLPREGRRQRRQHLRRREPARRRRRRPARVTSSIGKIGSPGLAVEDVGAAVLRDLRDDVARPAVLRDRDERRRGGEVAVPEVVLHGLEVPDALAGRRAQAEDRVGEQVVAVPVGAVEVVRRPSRSRRRPARASRRARRPTTRWRRRCTSTRPSARCRSRTRRDAGSCETPTSARRCGRRTRGCRPAPTAAPPARPSRGSAGRRRTRRACSRRC